jgi:glycosyltransferase involved in cell wall biosynthesis
MVKIAVYTIAKNEAKHVERWYNSSKEADYHFILDTGSTDRTVAIAKKLGINVVKATVKPWRFDVARNTALALLPADIDMCVSMDMDEILVAGWREKLETVTGENVHVQNTFTFSFNHDGTPGMQFGAVRTHSRHGYTWRYPVHEVVSAYGEGEHPRAWCDMEMQHHPDNTKSRGQYLDLLRIATKEYPVDGRMSFYYGRELMYNNKPREAYTELNRYIGLSIGTWPGERSDAMRYIAACTENLAEIEMWLKKSIEEVPERREGYVKLARHYYFQEQYDKALEFSEKSLAITERPLAYMCEDWAWNWEPWDVAAISAWVLGNKAKAIEYGAVALELGPHVQRLADNMEHYTRSAQ